MAGLGSLRNPRVRVRASTVGGHPEDGVADVDAAALPADAGSTVISAADRLGRRTVEVTVGGWRYEFEVEAEARATLRERATRPRPGVGQSGDHLEIRAIMPGRIVSIAVGAGEEVEVGQTLLVVEAMKMQNDLRAPRAGIVHSITVAAGSPVELGDILAVLR